MELRLLRYFLVVAEELHVGRAAERLHMAQQPLSAAIRRLESDLGVELFERAANRIRLTPAGLVMVEEAGTILRQVDAAAVRARRVAQGELGTLRVGYCSRSPSN
jgi:DNA-binding transcriptional LysR family regulator